MEMAKLTMKVSTLDASYNDSKNWNQLSWSVKLIQPVDPVINMVYIYHTYPENAFHEDVNGKTIEIP